MGWGWSSLRFLMSQRRQCRQLTIIPFQLAVYFHSIVGMCHLRRTYHGFLASDEAGVASGAVGLAALPALHPHLLTVLRGIPVCLFLS